MLGAMRRLYAKLRIDYGEIVDASIGKLPYWVQSTAFEDAAARCDPKLYPRAAAHAMVLVRAQRRLRELIDQDAGHEDEIFSEPPQPMTEPNMDPHVSAAIVRLCHGELLEAYAARRALQLCSVNEIVLTSANQTEFAQLCNDSYLVSIWTSAHAEYLFTVDDLLMGSSNGLGPTVTELLVPPPELHSIPCCANNVDLIALYERAGSPKACSKSAQTLLAVLTRSTNAGSRGWESTLEAILKESDGAVRVCMHSVGVALSGLNPCIHPASRRHWHMRAAVVRRWRGCNPANDFRDLVHHCPTTIKEVMRLHLGTLLAEDAATLEALALNNMPAGQLSLPPRTVAPTCLQAAMQALAGAGEDLATLPDAAIVDTINAHLTSEPRSRKKTMPRPAFKLLTTTNSNGRTTAPLSYCCSWLGGRCGPSAAAMCSATTVVSSLLYASFRADYVPFWLHSNHHGLRASRLDSAQYRALHERSPAHAMCTLIDERTALRVQRLALTVSHASLLTVSEALALMNVSPRIADVPDYDDDESPENVATSSASSRAVQEAERAVLSLNAREAAMIMLFARCCALRSQLLSFDLGATTRETQAKAVCKRLLITPNEGETHEQAALHRLPDHCTHLFACSECRRIANARQDGSGKDVPFNEACASLERKFGSLPSPSSRVVAALADRSFCKHVANRLQPVQRSHALRQALVRRAAHRRGTRGRRQHGRSRNART